MSHSYGALPTVLLIAERFGRRRPGGTDGRIECSETGQHQGTYADDDDIGPADVRRNRRHVINVRIEDLKVKSLLEKRHDRIDVQGNAQSDSQPQRDTEPADHQPLRDE